MTGFVIVTTLPPVVERTTEVPTDKLGDSLVLVGDVEEEELKGEDEDEDEDKLGVDDELETSGVEDDEELKLDDEEDDSVVRLVVELVSDDEDDESVEAILSKQF